MEILGTAIMLVAFGLYFQLVRLTNRLVRETNEGGVGRVFRWYSWHKAWVSHRRIYPMSSTRRSIVVAFALCFGLICAATLCFAVARIHQYGWSRQ